MSRRLPPTPASAVVIISNGFRNFHLMAAAAEMSRRRLLATVITGMYPKGWVAAAAQLFVGLGIRRFQRLLQRRVDVDDELVVPLLGPDFLSATDIMLSSRRWLSPLRASAAANAMRSYAAAAARLLQKLPSGPDIYHYRAGFGLESVAVARSKGMIALCDHSIVHPQLINYMVEHEGRYPPNSAPTALNIFWSIVESDISRSDHILVNSFFVKQTFIHCGIAPAKIDVIYLGVDDMFMSFIPPVARRDADGPIRFLFAGYFERRKGADQLVAAFNALGDGNWTFDLVGTIAPDMVDIARKIIDHPQTNFHGLLTRAELAVIMARSDVFVFPSLAEGSARVIFEAMACGCYIITTANAGSIVRSGVHGALVAPGNSWELAEAMRETLLSPELARSIGLMNAAVVASQYRQKNYGDALVRLYSDLQKRSGAAMIEGGNRQ